MAAADSVLCVFEQIPAVLRVFEEDINRDKHVLNGYTVRVMSESSDDGEAHEVLTAATALYSKANARGTLIGWLGPHTDDHCELVSTYTCALQQPQISFGCMHTKFSSKTAKLFTRGVRTSDQFSSNKKHFPVLCRQSSIELVSFEWYLIHCCSAVFCHPSVVNK